MSPPIKRTSWRLIAKPSPVPSRLPAQLADLLEGLEDPLQLVGGDAGAGVFDLKSDEDED